ncbi:hypothetical protein [Aquipseudomonas alcaligenes]|uniref:HEPN domain-containing protein n=1 Tax=Aquipseudomonas alcaligenes TaxID=43263 RepID=A0A1N6XPQ4_AQUAC|nr:hypothetical protein [Pseudomonas alcaligenes]SIR04270.1 hypothetical protein SAMN05878282_11411 [Pseudomonas alcaligenes]
MSLHEVAIYLTTKAKEGSGELADAYGRSAFNRYYYATFLTVRELLGALDSSWQGTSHANIPGMLEDAVINKIKKAAKAQGKSGLITKGREQSLISQAVSSATEIAHLMRAAYSVRVVSDYEPENKLVFKKQTFEIIGHTDSEAKNWMIRASREKGVLLSISKELGLVS